MSAAQKWLLNASVWLVALSGAVYAVFKYFGASLAASFPSLFPAQDDPFSAVQHPLQPWALDLHVVASPVLVFAVGWVFKDHILGKMAIPGAPVRRSGLSGILLLAPLVLSGYLLQTITNQSAHGLIAAVHLVAGGLFAGAFFLHVLLAPDRSKLGLGAGGAGSVGGLRIGGSRMK